jgi:DNA modification methylase
MKSEYIMKNYLDDFKSKLAAMELESASKDYYWRLAFWQKAGMEIPDVMKYENPVKALDSGYLSHKWHSYPAKFYPQFVRALLNICQVKRDYTIYDPYAGCGTSAVESKLLGMNYFGIDISKLAVMISQVKVDLDIDIVHTRDTLADLSRKFKSETGTKWAYTDFEVKWYNDYNRPQVLLLYYLIEQIKNEREKRFFKIALSSILRRVGNTKSGQIETRFEERGEKVDVLRLLTMRVNSMLADVQEYQQNGRNNCNITIEEGDANSYLPDEHADFIVTSPPYGNGLDYSRIHPLSIALLFGENEITNYRKGQTGTQNHVPNTILDTSFTEVGTAVINILEKGHVTRAKALSKYYVDMRNSMQNAYESLRNDRYAVIIIGPTKVHEVLIPNDDVLIDIGKGVGFELYNKINWTYDKTRRSGLEHKIKGETIVIFKKQS